MSDYLSPPTLVHYDDATVLTAAKERFKDTCIEDIEALDGSTRAVDVLTRQAYILLAGLGYIEIKHRSE